MYAVFPLFYFPNDASFDQSLKNEVNFQLSPITAKNYYEALPRLWWTVSPIWKQQICRQILAVFLSLAQPYLLGMSDSLALCTFSEFLCLNFHSITNLISELLFYVFSLSTCPFNSMIGWLCNLSPRQPWSPYQRLSYPLPPVFSPQFIMIYNLFSLFYCSDKWS